MKEEEKARRLAQLCEQVKRIMKKKCCSSVIIAGDFNLTLNSARKHGTEALREFLENSVTSPRQDDIDCLIAYPKDQIFGVKLLAAYKTGPFDHPIKHYSVSLRISDEGNVTTLSLPDRRQRTRNIEQAVKLKLDESGRN